MATGSQPLTFALQRQSQLGRELSGAPVVVRDIPEARCQNGCAMTQESIAELVRFAPDVYGFRYHNHVAMFVVTTDGVILVDAIGQASSRTPDLIQQAIRCFTDEPVKYFVYSHWALDHALGAATFAQTATFVAERRAVPKMKTANEPLCPIPELTVDNHLTLELGATKMEIYSADLWDDDDYVVIHLPESKVAMAVDFCQPLNLPFRTLFGPADRVIKRLEWIEQKLDFDVLVTGHATPRMTATIDDVHQQRQYLHDLSAAVRDAHSKGMADGSPEMMAAVRASLHFAYGSWRRFDEMLEDNIRGFISWGQGGSPSLH